MVAAKYRKQTDRNEVVDGGGTDRRAADGTGGIGTSNKRMERRGLNEECGVCSSIERGLLSKAVK